MSPEVVTAAPSANANAANLGFSDSIYTAGTRFPNSFLDSHSQQLRNKSIPWEGYFNAKLISREDLTVLLDMERNKSPASMGVGGGRLTPEYLSHNGLNVVSSLLNVLPAINNNEVIQTILVELDDLLPTYQDLFFQYEGGSSDPLTLIDLSSSSPVKSNAPPKKNVFTTLCPMITGREDEFISCKAARIFVTLASSDSELAGPLLSSAGVKETFAQIVPWLVKIMQGNNNISANYNNSLPSLATQFLQSLLTTNAAVFKDKVLFHEPKLLESLVKALCSILVECIKDQQKNTQLTYQVLYVWWILSFEGSKIWSVTIPNSLFLHEEPPSAVALKKHDDDDSSQSIPHILTPFIIDLIKSAVKEKVVRMGIGIIRNMLERGATLDAVKGLSHYPANITSALVGCRLLPVMDVISTRKFVDEEIPADIQYVKEKLSQIYQNLSTFDEYASEIRSGQLDWTPSHQSEVFWKQNVQKFHDRDMEMLRLLTRILGTSSQPKVLAIACHDLGQYVKHYPQGKKNLQELGAKQAIMQLMSHESSEVKYHALSAVQKYMSNMWNA